MRWSPHFGREMPHIEEVPGFTQVMIHGANDPTQLLGCVAAGRRLMPFGDCAPVVAEITSQLRLAEQRGEASTVTIEDAFAEPTPDPT